MPILMSMSAQPMTPRPILRLPRASSAIFGERVLVHVDHVVEEAHAAVHDVGRAGPSRPPGPSSRCVTNRERLTEPRLHASYGSSGCSPHGFVDSISPSAGVGLSRFIRSMKMMPGSPVAHAISTMRS